MVSIAYHVSYMKYEVYTVRKLVLSSEKFNRKSMSRNQLDLELKNCQYSQYLSLQAEMTKLEEIYMEHKKVTGERLDQIDQFEEQASKARGKEYVNFL